MTNYRVGFLGLGIMGGSMAHNLIKAGFNLVVWNRSPERTIPLLEAGARVAESPREIAQQCEIVFSCVTDDSALREVIYGQSGIIGALTGNQRTLQVFIDCSTVTPAIVRALAAEFAELGAGFLDAPVSGGDVGAKAGTLTIMVGGDAAVYEQALPYLGAIGKNIKHVGPSGTGQLTKCVNQVMVGLSIAAMTEGLLLAKRTGLNLDTTLSLVGTGAAGSWALNNYAPRLLRGEFGPGFFAKDMLKDLKIALATAESAGTELKASRLVAELFEELCSGPEGASLGNHALIKLYDNLAL